MELLAAILILGGTAGICWVLYGRGSGPTRCIGCGKCEHSCPQHLPIRELLKEVAKTFEGGK